MVVITDGDVANAVAGPVEVTSALALPVIGPVPGRLPAVGGGSSVGGTGTPLNDGVTGDVVNPGEVIVTPFDVVATGVVMVAVAGVVIVMGGDVPVLIGVVPFNCAATGSDVNVPPLNARPTTPIGTFELINNNPVTP